MNQNSKLIAEELLADPRLVEGKKLILEAIQEHQKKISHIKSPNPEYTESFQQKLDLFEEIRAGKLWYPYLGSGLGNQALVELLDGSIKYDLINGIGVHYLGHSHPDIIHACLDAAISNTVMQGHLQQNEDSLLFSELVLKASSMDHCFLTTSGAMANENALKIAFQKKFPASRVLAFESCFAGRSTSIAQITDNPNYRSGLPTTLNVDYVPFYRPDQPEASIENALKALNNHIKRYPKQHALMIFELVQGEAGFHVGSHDFFKALMSELKKHDITILVDEIQTFGRTPKLFAYQYFNLEEFVDIVTIGKLTQVCATLFKNTLTPRTGLLSQTFTTGTSVVRAGYVIVKSLIEGGYYGAHGKIQKLHTYFSHQLEKLHQKYPDLIAGPWGIGAMIALTPFQGDRDKVFKFCHDLYQAGVISFIAGSNPTRVRFLIPIGVIQERDIDIVIQIIETTLVSAKD